jgi:hypothetical protein
LLRNKDKLTSHETEKLRRLQLQAAEQVLHSAQQKLTRCTAAQYAAEDAQQGDMAIRLKKLEHALAENESGDKLVKLQSQLREAEEALVANQVDLHELRSQKHRSKENAEKKKMCSLELLRQTQKIRICKSSIAKLPKAKKQLERHLIAQQRLIKFEQAQSAKRAEKIKDIQFDIQESRERISQFKKQRKE